MKSISIGMSALRGMVIALLVTAGGCYEEHAPPPQETTAQQPPPPGPGAGTGLTDTPRPSHAAAKRSAQNTVDKVEQRQRELEKMLEDN